MVRGRNHPDVAVNDLLAADPREFAVLEDVKQLGLEPERDLADLVEENRPVSRERELAELVPVGARERPLLMAEQLRFEEVFGQGRAIHLEEGVTRPRWRAVERMSDELRADAALSEQQDGDVGGRELSR